jgi:hypothetical protein
MFDIEYSNVYIRSVIADELRAFPGVTKTMLNVRLKLSLRQSLTKIIDQMIEDEDIVVRYKTIKDVRSPVRVIYLAGTEPGADELRMDSNVADSEYMTMDTRLL